MAAASLFNSFFATWVNSSTFHAQHICSHASNSCRTMAHGVFVMGPEFGDDLLDKLKIVTLDAHSGKEVGYTNWEKHVVNGICQGTTFANSTAHRNCTTLDGGFGRVYDWGYEHFEPFQPNALPDSISVKVNISGADGQYFMMPAATVHFETLVVTGTNNSQELMIQYDPFFSLAFQDGDDALLHLVFSVAPVDDPIQNLTITGQYSIDGGKSWQMSTGDDQLLFENHIVNKHGTFFQSFQYNLRYKKYLLDQMVCFRVRASDSQLHEAHYQNCLKVCDKIVPFANPMGYCPDSAAIFI
eukprot:gnl/MRDRNA2_/MRDRNA2_72976_c0_seq2.p1 gnl/MRDRNA2_/MRDRNA2_72976_c0~~gnl/MRDRNA2_/MRDRNA2_72976_c0_seq2.p1  ORF type:complete len:326 (-),score=48.97 gnl/MRDRNA2_/MRDRNA2_72976_c0_seq2:131-1027(-)